MEKIQVLNLGLPLGEQQKEDRYQNHQKSGKQITKDGRGTAKDGRLKSIKWQLCAFSPFSIACCCGKNNGETEEELSLAHEAKMRGKYMHAVGTLVISSKGWMRRGTVQGDEAVSLSLKLFWRMGEPEE